ncbi:non-ribosomal peptide synthetase [Paenibacillus tengchongensis]|uniref:non-ribosomal peptide synthetase n=1 Tax=Paenibacillus tengchongensis TaxID=2608684 RepID=UPI00124DA394|nr:non-ribosomal peptide synthetase [Paenibacillus tengchongensis]
MDIKLDKNNIEDIIGLTSTQEGILFHYIHEPESRLYHEQLSLTLTGDVDIEVMQKSWDFVIESNEMLRTVYRWRNIENPVQIILKSHKVNMNYYDFSLLAENTKQLELSKLKESDLRNRIDITKESLRVSLCKLAESRYEMIISNHHILYDGWSNAIILEELLQAYNNYKQGSVPSKIQKNKFKSFIAEMKQLDPTKSRAFWNEYLHGFEPGNDYFRNTTGKSIIKKSEYTISAEISNKIKECSKQYKVTTASILYSTWAIMLQTLNNEDDILFGTVVSGRNVNMKNIETMVGMCINTIPLRVKINIQEKIVDLLMKIDHSLKHRDGYENTPLTEIKASSNLNQLEDLFNSIVVVENYPIKLDRNSDDHLTIENYSMVEETNYNITLSIIHHENISLHFSYNDAVINDKMVAKLGSYFENILDAISGTANQCIKDIRMLTDGERQQILYDFNDTRSEYPKEKAIFELFEEQAERTPDDVAVVFEEELLSYKKLNEKSNQLARRLRNKGVQTGTVVGIMMENRPETVICMMAILKAGGTFLPIDPEYPVERIEYMLHDSGTGLLITYEGLHKQVSFHGEILDVSHNDLYEQNGGNLDKNCSSNDVAYIIYTSGSTGKPKGVMVTHQGLVNYITWAQKEYVNGERLNFSLYSSISFDLTITSIYTPLIAGNQIIIYSGNEKVLLLEKIINDNKTEVMKLTPTHLKIMEDMDMKKSRLKKLIVGGELLKTDTARKVHKNFGGDIEIFNEYGPTETTVGCMIYKYDPLQDTNDSVPIGVPADNTQIYVLNQYLQPVAAGVIGEIYISGDGVARGYLGKPELTAEKFISNPFIASSLMYKTGDYARMLDDGNIEYIGRMDHQVKHRGYRIELGEVESKLTLHSSVKEAVVLVKNDKAGTASLCAYIVVSDDVNASQLRSYLLEVLPEYMIPSCFVKLENMPLSHNGKIDIKALPDPIGNMGINSDYEAPRDGIEEVLVNLWREILSVDSVGIHHNFFELGGHSLKATRLVSKIHKSLDVEIPLKEVFKSPTIKGLREYIARTEKKTFQGLIQVDEAEYYEVSSAQKRMYILQMFDAESVRYNIPGVMIVEGKLDRARLEKASQELIQRHEVLRTSFNIADDKISQRVEQQVDFQVQYVANSELTIEDELAKFIQPFDLSSAPLLRIGLKETEAEKYILLFDIHHIISDGVSMNIIINDFIKLYEGTSLEPLQFQYKDYAGWQNALLASEAVKKQEQYWLSAFAGEVPVLDMPTDYPRPSMQSFEGRSVQFEAGAELTTRLNMLAQESGSTLYMVLLAGFNALLSKYTGQEDIIVGSPIAGRPHADLQGIVGMFVNTLAMRNYPGGDKTFQTFLQEVKQNTLKAYENQDYPFEQLVEKLDLPRDMSRNPLFDAMFVLQNADSRQLELEGLRFKPYPLDSGASKFDLTLYAQETAGKITFTLEYSPALFKLATIERLTGHFSHLLEHISEDAGIQLKELDILSGEEKHQLTSEFNHTAVNHHNHQTVYQMFEKQAEKTPEQVALVFEHQTLSYRELNRQANKVASYLKLNGIGENDIIGIMAQRSFEMMIGIYGILKAGAAYVPVDPDYPEERIQYILDDSKAAILLTQRKLKEKIRQDEKELVAIEDLLVREDLSEENPVITYEPSRLMYLLYTSGSTGNPKGVMVRADAFTNLINWFTSEFTITANDNILLIAPVSFDLAQKNLYASLVKGGRLCLFTPGMYDYNQMLLTMKEQRITIVNCTPSAFHPLLEFDKKFTALESLRCVYLGGEPIKPALLVPWVKSGKCHSRIINTYGPTECTDIATSYTIDNEAIDQMTTVPIGKPIHNTQTYILDHNKQLVPVGTVGELYIGGIGVSAGYFNKAGLTAEKFVQLQLQGTGGQTVYRTGDLVRWLPDGNIEYLGRSDFQVKIRGFRIEPGEIESWLLSHEAVTETVVTDKEDKNGSKYLCAFVVLTKEVAVQELREHLSGKLPEHMIPSYFVRMEKLPLTPNGKIDLRMLPEPDKRINTGMEYEAPRNDVEQALHQIWSTVLDVEDIGINDNFFELGGHSLKATMLVSKIHEKLNVQVPLKELFKAPNIKAISEYIASAEKQIFEAILPVEDKACYEASSAQKRMYLLQQLELQSTGYNMPGVMEIDGRLDIEKLEWVFNQLIMRHDTLRTSFTTIGEQVMQIVNQEVDFNVEHSDFVNQTNVDANELINHFVKPFDLAKAPLLRVKVCTLKENNHILMFDMHHIISDGLSMGILVSEFSKLYEGKVLEELRIQYKDYAEWQNKLLRTEKLMHQEKYWLDTLSGEIPLLNLPTDFVRPAIQSFEGERVIYSLNKELTAKLKGLAKETGSTMYMVLLAGFNILLSKYSEQEDIIVGSPIAGRPHADLQPIIGMFVNTLVIRNQPEGSKSYKQFVEDVKQNALKAYENQDYQFEALVDKLNLRRDVSRNPLFDVMFAVEHMDSEEAEAADLQFKEYSHEFNVAKFDLTCTVKETEEELILYLEYCTKLFKRGTIERMIGHFCRILETVAENKNIKLDEIDMLTAEEKQMLVYGFNDTYTTYDRAKTIHERFEEQVEKTPDEVAVVFEDKRLTYRQLNKKSNQLARTLRQKGVKAESIVGIMLERSIDMIIAIMGVLKAGGAYLPIDPDIPAERINYMIGDSKTQILILQSKFMDKKPYDCHAVVVEDEQVYEQQTENLRNINQVNDLAYVIYTSGSTGTPKGVMIEHKNAIHVSNWYDNKYDVRANKNTLQITNLAFDVAVLETLVVLLNGGTIFIPRKETIFEKSRFREYVDIHQINSVQFVPAIINDLLLGNEVMETLTVLISGGDVLENSLKNEVISKGYTLHNHYGPTETTVDTIITTCDETDVIGRPVENSQVYIMSMSGQLQPMGMPGEMYIGGDGVARGYLNRPELTLEKFVDNPFIPGGRLYKTGDLGRWTPNGVLEFLGRIDNQVKIRGIRIELGEVERQLLRHESIREAIVVDRKNRYGEKYLCAYITSDHKLCVNEIRRSLFQKLPEYMIPSSFMQIDKMPLTSNGKVDRKSLPEPTEQNAAASELDEPGNERETRLAEIWKEVLGLEQVGMNQNFFDLGGHSLKATIMAAKIHKAFNVLIPLVEIFKSATIKELSSYIAHTELQNYAIIPAVAEQDYYPLSRAQNRLFIVNQLKPNDVSYNMPTIASVEGVLDTVKLEHAVNKLIQRHDVFRTSFDIVNGEPVQKINKEVDFKLNLANVSGTNVEEVISDLIVPFDLSRPPLLRVNYVRMEQGTHYLMMDMHHIISDGVSMDIFIQELMKLYNDQTLDELEIQYKDYCAWQRDYLNSSYMKDLENYWSKQTTDLSYTGFPKRYDINRDKVEGANVEILFDNERCLRIGRFCKEHSITKFTYFASILNLILMNELGKEDIVIGTPVAGRNHDQLQNVIGVFLNVILLRTQIDKEHTFAQYLGNVNDTIIEAMKHQDYPYEELHSMLVDKEGWNQSSLFSIMLNYMPYQDTDSEMNSGNLEDVTFTPYNTDKITPKYDVTFYVNENRDDVSLNMIYNSSLIEDYIIQRIGQSFLYISDLVLGDSEVVIKEIEFSNIMEDAEEEDLMMEEYFNTTDIFA